MIDAIVSRSYSGYTKEVYSHKWNRQETELDTQLPRAISSIFIYIRGVIVGQQGLTNSWDISGIRRRAIMRRKCICMLADVSWSCDWV